MEDWEADKEFDNLITLKQYLPEEHPLAKTYREEEKLRRMYAGSQEKKEGLLASRRRQQG